MEYLISIIVCFFVYTLVNGTLLYFAGQITGAGPYYKGMLLVAGASYLSELPFLLLFEWKEIFWFLVAGWIVSLIVLVSLLVKLLKADIFPDIMLMLGVFKVSTIVLNASL